MKSVSPQWSPDRTPLALFGPQVVIRAAERKPVSCQQCDRPLVHGGGMFLLQHFHAVRTDVLN